jgi:hypothetical protein
MKGSIGVAGHKCGGYETWTDYGKEFDCEYDSDWACESCVFVVGAEMKDYRYGKRPWKKTVKEK